MNLVDLYWIVGISAGGAILCVAAVELIHRGVARLARAGFNVTRADHRRAGRRLGCLVAANRQASYVERRQEQERADRRLRQLTTRN